MTRTLDRRLSLPGLPLGLVGPVLVAAITGSGCSDDTGPEPQEQDAGRPGAVLRIVSPGRDVGLSPGASVQLVVGLTDQGGRPLEGRRVDFSLSGSYTGATLEPVSALTDSRGLASSRLQVGAQDGQFQVFVTAEEAPRVVFSVVVSAHGFADLSVLPVVQGDTALPVPVTLDLFLGPSCAELDADAAPTKTRTVEQAEEAAEFRFVPVGEFVSIRAHARSTDSGWDFVGCVDLLPDTLPAGTEVSVLLPLRREPLDVGTIFDVTTRLDFAPSEAGALLQAVERATAHGTCPLGPAQQFLDCLVWALSSSTVGDATGICVPPETLDATAELVSQARGIEDGGCRQAVTQGGNPSLEQVLYEQVRNPEAWDRYGVTAAASEGALHWTLVSLLTLRQTAGGAYGVEHGFVAARAVELPGSPEVWLRDVGSPVVRVRSARADTASGTDATLVFRREEFGLRPMRILQALVASAVFGEPAALDYARFWSDTGDAQDACAAMSPAICGALGYGDDCLGGACERAFDGWRSFVLEGFRGAERHEGPDFVLESGRVTPIDEDGDGKADGLGSIENPGEWTVAVSVSEQVIEVQASFVGAPYVPSVP